MTAAEIMALIKASGKPYYCYVLFRPDGRPFYVGAGKGKRVLDHERYARETWRSHKQSLIRKILKDGDRIDYWIEEFFATWDEAAARERELIAYYGRADLRKGPLANRTDGGDGFIGIKWEMTPARAEGVKKAAAKLRGRKHTEEHKAKISANGTKGRKKSPEEIAKWAESRAGWKPTEEHLQKLWEGRDKLGPPTWLIEPSRKWRAENMDALIAERRTRWDDPDYRERHMKAMADPVRRQGMSEKMYERLRYPDKRQKLLDAVRAGRSQPIIANGILYPSITAAAEAIGVYISTIRNRLRRREIGYEVVPKDK